MSESNKHSLCPASDMDIFLDLCKCSDWEDLRSSLEEYVLDLLGDKVNPPAPTHPPPPAAPAGSELSIIHLQEESSQSEEFEDISPKEVLELFDLESPLQSPRQILQTMFEEELMLPEELNCPAADRRQEQCNMKLKVFNEGFRKKGRRDKVLNRCTMVMYQAADVFAPPPCPGSGSRKRKRKSTEDDNRPYKKKPPKNTVSLSSKIRPVTVLCRDVMKEYKAADCAPDFFAPLIFDNPDSGSLDLTSS